MDGGRFCAQILQVLKMPEDQKMANSCHQRVRVCVHLVVPSFTHLFKENACCRTRSRQNGVLSSKNFALTKAGIGCERTGSPQLLNSWGLSSADVTMDCLVSCVAFYTTLV